MVTNSYCWTAYADGQPVDHMCEVTYTYVDSGSYYDSDLSSMASWNGASWTNEVGMINVNGDWNGYVKVNRTGTKIVTDVFHCVGDLPTSRMETAKAAMELAQSKTLMSRGTYPVGQQITMYMDNGDTQTWAKSEPGIEIFLKEVGTCKPAKK